MNIKENTTQFMRRNAPLIITLFAYVMFEFLFLNAEMFWDSITIISGPATFLFEHGLLNCHYPTSLDNGDPQFVPFYIALMWSFFGRSMLITHLAFLPIVILLLCQLYRLTAKLFSSKFVPYVFFLLAIDPTLMSQSLGMYQDAFLILFSILIINALLDKNKIKIMIFMSLLCLVSRRGMLLTFGFMLAYYLYLRFIEKESFSKTLKEIVYPYLPATIIVFAFIIWRLTVYGWFFTTNHTTTGNITTFYGIVKNIFVLIRWFIDDGRIFLWLILIAVTPKLKGKIRYSRQDGLIILLFSSLLIIMMAVTLPLANPFGARYFVVHYALFAIIFSKLIISTFDKKYGKKILLITAILLFSGNFWIYPEKLSQSWDASLAHLPYIKLKAQTIEYFEKNHIDFQTVGVGFPMGAELCYTNINNDKRKFGDVNFKRNKWVVYSNIFNFTDHEIEQSKQWLLIKEFQQGNVFMKIYKNPKYINVP